jgi:hypothetical protein
MHKHYQHTNTCIEVRDEPQMEINQLIATETTSLLCTPNEEPLPISISFWLDFLVGCLSSRT